MNQQIAALKALHSIYHQQAKYGPRRVEHECKSKEDARTLARELTQEAYSLYCKTSDAQEALLKSGYPVPDEWLSVNISPRVVRRIDKKKQLVIYTPPGLSAMKRAADQIRIAIMRKQCEPETIEWSREMTKKEIAGRLGEKGIRNLPVICTIKKVTNKLHRVRLDTLTPSQRDKIEAE